jgi:hypothetical protein
MRRRRWLRTTVAVVGLVLLVQVGTYLLFAHDLMPAVMVKFLPRYTEPSRGEIDFVCVYQPTWASLTPAQQRALDRALARHVGTIYHSEPEIPYSRILQEGLGGLKRGCVVMWDLHEVGPFWFSATCWEATGNLAGSSTRAVFVWVLGFWVHAWTTERGYI